MRRDKNDWRQLAASACLAALIAVSVAQVWTVVGPRYMSYSHAVTELAPDLVCPCSVWDVAGGPDAAGIGSTRPREAGVRLRADVDGSVVGIRFYRSSAGGGPFTTHLWTTDGTLLATAELATASRPGWQVAPFAAPVFVQAHVTLIASYYSAGGEIVESLGYFLSGKAGAVSRPPLRALADGEDGPNGSFRYGSAGFPTETLGAANYWVDLLFTPAAGAPDRLQSMWGNDAEIAVPATAPGPPVEVGVKFVADVDGLVRGLRVYQGAPDMPGRVGTLWSQTGVLLASGALTARSQPGWAHLWFSEPVPISARTIYVASYHAPDGRFAYTPAYFETAPSHDGRLRPLPEGETGSNGVFGYGPSAFPMQPAGGANYWVDVLFTATGRD